MSGPQTTSHPLSSLQRSLLFEVAERGPDGTNVEQIVVRLGRAVDPEVLERALHVVHSRFDALRAVLRPGRGEQVILAEPAVVFERRPSRGEPDLEPFLAEDRVRPFDLEQTPPVRWTLLEAEGEGSILVWSFLHVLLDGRSFAPVLRDLWRAEEAVRTGQIGQLPAPPPSPVGVYDWLGRLDQGPSLDFWRERLARFGGKPAFPTQLAPLKEGAGLRRGRVRRVLDAEATEVLARAAREHEVTPNTLVQAAWAVALARLTRDDDVLFGVARAGRHAGPDEAREAVGLLMNNVPVRADVGPGRTVADVWRDLRAQSLAARPHEQVPLVEIARIAGRGSAEVPFDSTIVFDRESLDARMARLEPGRPERYELYEQTSFPLTLYAYDDAEMLLELGFDRRRVLEKAASCLLEQVATALEDMARHPGKALLDVELSSEAEKERLATGLEGPTRPPRAPSVVPSLLERCRGAPDRVAVRYRDRALTYGELDAASAAVARDLIAAGCQTGDLVGVYRERDLYLPAVLLGVWRAGAAYVPLDPTYPEHRIAFKLQDARMRFVITHAETTGRLPPHGARVLEIDRPLDASRVEVEGLDPRLHAADLAYMIYTSGSTGRPKGTLVEHGQVASFFEGMDEVVSPEPGAVWLAVTSLSFDISVLELVYTLSRGFEVVVHDERDDQLGAGGRAEAPAARGAVSGPRIDGPRLGLMFFSGARDDDAAARYDFALEAVQKADRLGLSAVWTPERHFHEFGGPYPNPAVLGAALARATTRLDIRAGSVVLPLHHPARVAEEWAVVDNLSRGRVGISFASGWHARDFVLRPGAHAERKRVLSESIDTVRRLWRGEKIRFPGPDGEHEVTTLPRPVQPELPVWVTAAGNPATFEEAGRLGANILTHLLGQTFEQVEEKIRIYREARAKAGHPGPGTVTLMLHTFLGEDRGEVEALVREPMKAYLRSAFGLVRDNAFDFPVVAKRVEAGADLDHAIQQLSEEELDALHEHAFARYFERSGLFGTLEDGRRVAERAKAIGADEIACLIDFGVPFDAALESLDRLGELQASFVSTAPADDDFSLPALVARHGVTHLQCTPSRARILALDPASRAALGSLRRLFVGGEMLPSDLARELVELGPGEVWNMYGPTETTVWSACHRVEGTERSVPVGRPIANTVIRVVDERGRLAPIGSTGEVCIGGLGVTRGYFRRNDLSAQRFGVDPFAEDPRAKIYKTGDLGRWRADGRLELLGRSDHQVKIRGYRIELGEIETVLRAHPDVRAAVVAPWAPDAATPPFLVAYVVPSGGASFDEAGLRAHLRTELPAYMVPSRFVRMVALPLLPNGKLDRQGLPAPSEAGPAPSAPARPAPAQPPQPAPAKPGSAPQQANDVADPTPAPSADQVEAEIASVWKEVLGVEKVDRHQNFFDIGGHSLLVVQVHGRLKSQHPDLGITELFRFPTVGSLAEHLVARALAETGGPDSRAGSRRSALARRRAQRRRV